jgi:hypothetical protein
VSRSNERRPRTGFRLTYRFVIAALFAITILTISACESPFEEKVEGPMATFTVLAGK